MVTTGQKLAQKLYGELRKRGGHGEFASMSMHHRCTHCGNDWSKVGTETVWRHAQERGDKENLQQRLCITGAPIMITTGQKLAQKLYGDMRMRGGKENFRVCLCITDAAIVVMTG